MHAQRLKQGTTGQSTASHGVGRAVRLTRGAYRSGAIG